MSPEEQGRIVAVADVIDALTHNRQYTTAWSTSDAIAEVSSHAGTPLRPACRRRLPRRDPTPLALFVSNLSPACEG
jgi:hypothetical protein